MLEKIFGGWQIGGVHRYQSGLPVVLSYGAPPATEFLDIFGVRGQLRPNLTGEQLVTGNDPEGIRFSYLNRGAFAPPPSYTAPPTTNVTDPAYRAYYADPQRFFGTAPPVLDDVKGQSVLSENLSLLKKTRLPRDIVFEIRAELFNLFNRHTYFRPAGDLNAGNFGESTANHEPRTIQLGFRLIF